MTTKIAIITNDNVFFRLVDTYINKINTTIFTKHISSISEIESDFFTMNSNLIIIDGNLQVNSPIEITYHIRYKLHIYSTIWFFTEIRTQEYLYKAKEVGVNRIVQKPFDPIEIMDDIRVFIHLRKDSTL